MGINYCKTDKYVGQTSNKLKVRFNQNAYAIRNLSKFNTYIYQHFKSTGHKLNNICIQPIEKVSYDHSMTTYMKTKLRHVRELEWIKRLQTPFPFGLNDIIFQQGNISRNPEFDIFGLFEINKRNSIAHGIRKKW